jgi:sorbitol-6-phosphate 2-dehydrogenase
MKRFKNKIAVVTGAGQGLGEHIACSFAKEGAKTAILDINKTSAERVAEHIRKKFKVDSLSCVCNITDDDNVKDIFKQVVKKFKRIDILISNAGILIAKEITEYSADEWEKVIQVNLIGYFICAKYAAAVMKKQRSGVIIQINSKSGKKGSYKNSAYAASKFGGIGLTQSIALDLAPYNIRVNAVCPGNLLDSPLWTDSLYGQYAEKWGISEAEVKKKYIEQVPLGRGCAYEDVSNVVGFLASDESDYMTGQAINVTGGQEMR